MSKSRSFILGILLLLISSASSNAVIQDRTDITKADSPKLELKGIQSQIHQAFYECMAMQNDDKLNSLIRLLENGTKNKSVSISNLIAYWHSYALYYQAIFHMQTKQPNKVSTSVTRGLEILEAVQAKTSEEYAMIARLEGLGVAFAGSKAATMAQSMMKHGHLSVELNDKNPRAYVVAGINDFYTPKAFGGRTKTKEYLTKALALAVQETESPYTPSWGREEAYEYLIRYLLEEEQGNGAKELKEKALKEFPNNFMINSLPVK